MATTKEYRDFILEQLSLLDNITCRAMMGEYLLYYNTILFGGIYDSRLLVKMVESNQKYNMKEEIPYKGAKPMYVVLAAFCFSMTVGVLWEFCKFYRSNCFL